MPKYKMPRLRGSRAAFKMVTDIASQLESTQTGCFEELAEYVMNNQVSLDEGLDEMVRRGLLNGWPSVDQNES